MSTVQQSVRESVIAEARALEPVLEGLLNRIRDVLIENPPAVNIDSECDRTERTDNRMRGYLASLRMLRGVGGYRDDVEEAHHRGRSLIERLALSAEGTGTPTLRLTPHEVADVLSLMGSLEPIEPETWWNDPPDDEPSHVCGFYLLLQALEESLRAVPVAPTPPRSEDNAEQVKVTRTSELPRALLHHLRDQQRHAAELVSLLERIDEDDSIPMCMGLAARAARDLENALDVVTLGKALKAEEARPS